VALRKREKFNARLFGMGKKQTVRRQGDVERVSWRVLEGGGGGGFFGFWVVSRGGKGTLFPV